MQTRPGFYVIPILLCLLAMSGCGADTPAPAPTADNSTSAAGASEAASDLAAPPAPPAGAATTTAAPSVPAQPSAAAAPGQVPTSKPASAAPAKAATPKPPAQPTAEQIAKWALPTFEPLRLLACSDGFGDPAVFCLAIRPDGKQFVLGGAKLTLWNTQDAQPSVEMLANYKSDDVERPIGAVAISGDGKWLAAGDQKGMVRVWTLSDQAEVLALRAHNGHISQLAISPDGRQLATTSYSGEVNLWQLPEGTKLKSLKMDKQEIKRLEFLSDRLLASAGSEAGIWNVESGEKVAPLTTEYVRGPALGLSHDRRILAFNDADSNLQRWDVQDAKPSGPALRGAGAHRVAFSPDGKWIATSSQDSILRIWDAATGAVVQVIDADGGLTSALAWLPESNALLAATAEGRVRIWGTAATAEAIGIQGLQLPAPESIAPGVHRSMTSEQLARVIDLRSFPRLPGATPQWSDFGMCSYFAPVAQKEAELFYRHTLQAAGWTEQPQPAAAMPGLYFQKDGCQLSITFASAGDFDAKRAGELQISLFFAGNYDVRWLPKIAPINSKSAWESFSSASYRTKAQMTDVEVALLKQLHEAGWTPYTRLAASSNEDPKSRNLSFVQGGSMLTVSIGYPADSTQELVVQNGVSVARKSLPIPPDAGWIEYDVSTDLQTVVNTKMNLQQTAEYYDKQMAAEGWLAREAGRKFKDDRAWLPYIRGQQDVLLRLEELPEGGTRIVVGDAYRSSWQLKKPAGGGEKEDKPVAKPGIEAADIALPEGAQAVKFDVDQKNIEFEVPGSTPAKLGEQFVARMESLNWKREGAGVLSDEYVFITFSRDKSEIQLRARSAPNKATAMISGDGLLWEKPLPTAPERISYETWLRRGKKKATLDLLDEFANEMHKIPAGGSAK